MHFTSPIRRYADVLVHRRQFPGNFGIQNLTVGIFYGSYVFSTHLSSFIYGDADSSDSSDSFFPGSPCNFLAELWVRVCRLAHILDIDTNTEKPMVQSHQVRHTSKAEDAQFHMKCFIDGFKHASLLHIYTILYYIIDTYDEFQTLYQKLQSNIQLNIIY